MSVELSSLTIERELGEGGYGIVHRVLGTPIAGDPRPMVLKRPKPGLDPVHIPAVLEGMRHAVLFRNSLSAQDRLGIDEIAVWPVTMVRDRGQDVGCLLPLIPPEFFMDIPAKGGLIGTREQRIVGYLAASVKDRNDLGYDSPDFHDDALRLHLLSKLARAIELLHQHGMVFGDLNPRNEVFAFAPVGVRLLDCDGVAHVSDNTRASRQGHFPRWTPPEMKQNDRDRRPDLKKMQDFQTDVYKLGLAFARFIHGATAATQRMALPVPTPTIITGELASLIARALDPEPTVRPDASELRQAAEDAVRAVVGPPVVTRASLNKLVTLRGGDVIASWTITAGSPYEVEIAGPGAQRMKVQSGSDSAALRVLNAGSVTLHVQTKYASVTHLIGEVDCYELPPFQLPTNILPAPHIPALNAFIAPNVLRRDMEVPLPAWPSSMGQLTQGMASFVSTAPSVDNLGVSLVQAIQASGIYALGAELVGGFPLPDTASLTAGLI